MIGVDPQMRKFSKRLIDFESRESQLPEAQDTSVFNVSEKLRNHLVVLMGIGGFRALLVRALELAKPEAWWLSQVSVNSSGSIEGSAELLGQLKPEHLRNGRVILLAQLLSLLIAFIGVDLTLGIVRDVWDEVQFDDLNIEIEGKNEQ